MNLEKITAIPRPGPPGDVTTDDGVTPRTDLGMEILRVGQTLSRRYRFGGRVPGSCLRVWLGLVRRLNRTVLPTAEPGALRLAKDTGADVGAVRAWFDTHHAVIEDLCDSLLTRARLSAEVVTPSLTEIIERTRELIVQLDSIERLTSHLHPVGPISQRQDRARKARESLLLDSLRRDLHRFAQRWPLVAMRARGRPRHESVLAQRLRRTA